MEMATILCVTLVVIVNGWTDAPNAITAVVSSGAMPYPRAVALAAVFNLLGVMLAAAFFPGVAQTMLALSHFPGAAAQAVGAAICIVLLIVAAWGTLAWRFGIPTSESHALLAGVAGAALALQTGAAAPWDVTLWTKVGVGLAGSLFLGWGLAKGISLLLKGILRRLPPSMLTAGQSATAAGLALLHGAQDGQKFMAMLLATGGTMEAVLLPGPRWLPAAFLCGAAMTLGTSLGGKRIIDNVGGRLAPVNLAEGICGDMGAVGALGILTILGLPVSTSHLRVAALAGSAPKVDKGALGEMLWAWGLTLPVCFGVAYLAVRLLVA